MTTANIERAKDYLTLTKPRVTWLILITTAAGYFFGAKSGSWGGVAVLRFMHTLLGTALMASATAALNQLYERESDGRMRRTSDRPLPSGRMSPGGAFWFGIALAIAGAVELAWGANVVAMLIAVFTLASYLFLYTPLKQRSWLAIAWIYREDYARAGIRMLPVVEPDGKSTARHIVAFASTLIPVSLVPVLLGMTGKIYLVGGLVLGGYYLYTGLRVAMDRTNVRARLVLMASVIYLPLIMSLLVLDRPGM